MWIKRYIASLIIYYLIKHVREALLAPKKSLTDGCVVLALFGGIGDSFDSDIFIADKKLLMYLICTTKKKHSALFKFYSKIETILNIYSKVTIYTRFKRKFNASIKMTKKYRYHEILAVWNQNGDWIRIDIIRLWAIFTYQKYKYNFCARMIIFA